MGHDIVNILELEFEQLEQVSFDPEGSVTYVCDALVRARNDCVVLRELWMCSMYARMSYSLIACNT